jgi:hypothetical protein
MLAKYTIAAVAGSALLASVAFAQSPTATTDRDNMSAPAGASSTSSSFQGDWRASKVVGLNVYNDKNESVGSINDLLTDKSGSIKAVVIGGPPGLRPARCRRRSPIRGIRIMPSLTRPRTS